MTGAERQDVMQVLAPMEDLIQFQGERVGTMSLREVQTEVERRAATIAAPACYLPTYGKTTDHARPHIEIDGRGYHLVVVARGVEESRHTASDLDELLFLVFKGVSGMARDYELQHKVETADPRRLLFARHIELLSQLSVAWARREAQEHERLLPVHPFDDGAMVRAKLCRELRELGHPSEIAWQMACDRFPVPDGG